jgi:hypothetical protein
MDETARTPPRPLLMAAQWTRIMDIVFGGIVVFGLENLVLHVGEALQRPVRCFVPQLYAAVAVYVFLIYDVAVFHMLVEQLPYRERWLGFVRFFLDLVMAFTLMMVVVPTCLLQGFATVTMVVGTSVWHVAAGLWHWVAHREHGRGAPRRWAYLPHALAIAAYWLFLAGAVAVQHRPLERASLAAPFPLAVLSTLIIGVALLRMWQMLAGRLAPRP